MKCESGTFEIGDVVTFNNPNNLFNVEKMIVGKDFDPNKVQVSWFDNDGVLHRASF